MEEPRAPLPARLLGGGARGARRVAQAAGVDRAVEAATEEAIVRAVESPAVERALVRVLQGPAVEEAMRGAVHSPAVERALIDALDSELVDEVWKRLLASDEAQQLVERIAEAPEVRAAIASQGVGFLDDIRRQIGRIARKADGAIERILRRITRRPQRTGPTECAGVFTRTLAFVIDVGVLNLAFIAISALVALVVSLVFPSDAEVPALAIGAAAWLIAGAAFMVAFWGLLGQTPGMRIVGLRVVSLDQPQMDLRIAMRRLLGRAQVLLPAARVGVADLLALSLLVARHALVLVSRRDLSQPWSGRGDLERPADPLQLPGRVGEEVLVADEHASRGVVITIGAPDDAGPVAPDAGLPADERLPPLRGHREGSLVERPGSGAVSSEPGVDD